MYQSSLLSSARVIFGSLQQQQSSITRSIAQWNIIGCRPHLSRDHQSSTMSSSTTTTPSEKRIRPVIVVHGGAGAHNMIQIEPAYKAAKREGIKRAAKAGWKVLQEGGSAEDAVVAAIVVMEDDPYMNAGVGSTLTRSGGVQMDAMVMSGSTLEYGGVLGLRNIAHPIKVAAIAKEKADPRFICGEYAKQFALENGISEVPTDDFVVPTMKVKLENFLNDPKNVDYEDDPGHDTVGAVALDCHGNTASAVSTGGKCGSRDGRVGSGGQIGCGCYADLAGGVSGTGDGEGFMKTCLCARAVHQMAAGMSVQQSLDACVELLVNRAHSWGGLIGVDAQGNVGIAYSTKSMPWCHIRDDKLTYAMYKTDTFTEDVAQS